MSDVARQEGTVCQGGRKLPYYETEAKASGSGQKVLREAGASASFRRTASGSDVRGRGGCRETALCWGWRGYEELLVAVTPRRDGEEAVRAGGKVGSEPEEAVRWAPFPGRRLMGAHVHLSCSTRIGDCGSWRRLRCDPVQLLHRTAEETEAGGAGAWGVRGE